MSIDPLTLTVAAFSGLVGALATAYLSYVVRVKVQERAKRERQKAMALVYFLRLTDFVAADFYLNEFCSKLKKIYDAGSNEIEFSHKVVIEIANAIESLDAEAVKQLQDVLKPAIAAFVDSIDKFTIPMKSLIDLDTSAIATYSRFQKTSSRLKAYLLLAGTLTEKGNVAALEASTLNSAFLAFRAFAQDSGILRATFKRIAGISDESSTGCLIDSYAAIQKDVYTQLENKAQLQNVKIAASKTAAPTSIADKI